MKRVTGIGGIFFKTQDTEKMKAWYNKHLGIESGDYGATLKWRDLDNPEKVCVTAWSLFSEKSKHFEPSQKDFMFNYRVENLTELMKLLVAEGVQQIGTIEEYEYGKFGWILDPEGNKIELWEPAEEKKL